MNFAAFDLNLLRVFDAMLRERNATRAGETVGLSQPAVSSALNRLRHALDDQLFVRRGPQMVPTPKAEALAGPVAEALALLERSLMSDARFDPAATERTFTLLASDFFSLMLFPALLERIIHQAPKVRLRVLEIPPQGVSQALLDGRADLALERAMTEPVWMASTPLFQSAFAIVAAAGHPDLAAAGVKPGEPIPLDLYCALPHVLRTIEGDLVGVTDQALAELGRRRRVALALTQFPGVLLAVARSRAIAAVPKELAEAFATTVGVEVFQTPLDMPAARIDMQWHRRQGANPAHLWLRTLIVETLQAQGLSMPD